MDSAIELRVRQMIMSELADRVADRGFLLRADLEAFSVDGSVHKLLDRNGGIWNPQGFAATLTVMSKPESGYMDSQIGGSLFRYDYQRNSTEGFNSKLRKALDLQLPIILLRWIRAGVYVPVFPVYVIADDYAARQFVFALDEGLRYLPNPLDLSPPQRSYAERITKQRLHQAEFRGRILRAYKTQCAVCNLKHGKLLDAAHITPDNDDLGVPVASNGMSLCKIHHSAYDNNLMGISPDYIVHINQTLLLETDGPMLRHGLQEMHRRELTIPSARSEKPDRDRLNERFIAFRSAG